MAPTSPCLCRAWTQHALKLKRIIAQVTRIPEAKIWAHPARSKPICTPEPLTHITRYLPGGVILADDVVVALAHNPAVLDNNSTKAAACKEQLTPNGQGCLLEW